MGGARELRTGTADPKSASARADYVFSHFAEKTVSGMAGKLGDG
jgi:hypothetical protein